MSDTEAKTKPASPRKLRKLREEGNVAQASEAASFFGAAAGTIAVLVLAGATLAMLVDIFEVVMLAATLPFDEAVRAASSETFHRLAFIVAPIAAAPIVVGVVATIVSNGGIVFAIKPVTPQVERVSPLSGLKRIYGRRGWIETAVTFVRIVVWLAFVAVVALVWLPAFAGAVQCGLPCQARSAIPPLWLFGMGFVAVLVLAAGADVLAQRSIFLFEQMMTESEVKQERKDAYGDPGIRKERRRRAREEPPDPNAIGRENANLCFFDDEGAVAIRFHPKMARIPRVCAKAKGGEAVEMREAMAGAGFTIARSDEVVRGCRAVVLGGPLPSEHYEAFVTALEEATT